MRRRCRAVSLIGLSVLWKALGAVLLGAATMVPVALLGEATAGAQTPSTSVVLPADGATVSGNTLLDATASADSCGVVFGVSGGTLTSPVVISTTASIYGYFAEWNTKSVPNGTYSLISVATACTFPLMIGTSSPITITVNNPLTSVLVPSNGATVAGPQVVLDASASAGVTQVQFELTGGSLSDSVIATAVPTYYGWIAIWNSQQVASATYTLQSVATGVDGSTATSPGINITVEDSVQTTVILPTPGDAFLGTAVLDATASGSSPITSVKFEYSLGPAVDVVIATATPTLYGWIAEWDTTNSTNNLNYEMQSVATDAAGTVATSAPVKFAVVNLP